MRNLLSTTQSVWRSWLPGLTLAATLGGCATLHPVPAGDQPVAQETVAGVSVSVPRLDTGDYPGDVLDVATAVLVVVENRSQYEILIDPESFSLGPAGAQPTGPIAPQQLSYKKVDKGPELPESAMLAWRGG